jgi:ribosomal protein L7/L12
MKYDVFISYSRKDINTAKQICSVLENYARYYKFKYFFDQDDIICRDEYLKRISSAISESKAMLFIASKNSYKSEFCAKELLFADKRGVRIHQYRIDDAEIPLDIDMLLGTHQYREAKSTSIENFVREVLANSLRCTIESLSSLKEKERRLEDAKRREQADKYRIKQAKLDKLQSRSLEIQSQIISFQQAIMKLEKEKLLVEKEIRELGLTSKNKPPVLPKYDVLISKVGINRLQVVQCVRMLTNLPLKDSKEIVYRVPSFIKEGVTEQEALSAKRALEAVGVGVEIFVDKTSWDVYLKSPGLAKYQVTKAIRDTMGLMTLSEALQTVNNAPCYVACNKSKSVATQIVKALVDAGAEVELR